MKKERLLAIIILAYAAGSGLAIPPVAYGDGRPQASLRLEAKDQGVVLKHGGGPGDCDILGAREAIVRVNGKELGTLWLAPWRVDITSAVKPGDNMLEVEVVNVWNNRLMGDAALPTEQRLIFVTAPTVKKTSPLLPAGLLGPVTVQAATLLLITLLQTP